MKIESNLERIELWKSIYSAACLRSSYLPKRGLAAASTDGSTGLAVCDVDDTAWLDADVSVCSANSANCASQSCAAGQYSASDGSGCTPCSAGGFYQDVAGAAGDASHCGCKQCNNGTYSPSPGATDPTDCVVCPIVGTRLDLPAGYRACWCQDGYARNDRFGPCERCDEGGGTQQTRQSCMGRSVGRCAYMRMRGERASRTVRRVELVADRPRGRARDTVAKDRRELELRRRRLARVPGGSFLAAAPARGRRGVARRGHAAAGGARSKAKS